MPFRDREERRLRWGWRSIVPMLLAVPFLVISFLASAPLAPLLQPLVPAEFPGVAQFLRSVALRVLPTLVVLVVWARFVDRRRIPDYGLCLGRAWWTDLLGGLLIGAFLSIASFLALLALGWGRVTGVASPSASFVVAFALMFVAALGIGLWEEILYRGLAFKNAAEGLRRSTRLGARGSAVGAWMAVSLGFTLYHILLAGSLVPFPYYMVSSLLIGLGYLLTGQLALPIGLHAMYDFFHGAVFVTEPVPGTPSLLNLQVYESAPALFVGNAGLLEIVFIVAAMVLTLGWVRWRTGELKIQTHIAEWTPRDAPRSRGTGRVR